jgi:hypothetical protein
MGKWESELMIVAERSAKNKKGTDEKLQMLKSAVEAAQKFVNAHAKGVPKINKASSQMLDASHECAEAAGELMILEEKFDKAKKDKDDAAMKKIAAEMKPLIGKFDCGRQDLKTAVETAYEALEEITKQAVDLKGMVE